MLLIHRFWRVFPWRSWCGESWCSTNPSSRGRPRSWYSWWGFVWVVPRSTRRFRMRFPRLRSSWVGTYHNDGMVPHCALNFGDLWLHGVVLRHGDGEFSDLDQDVTQKSGDFLHQRFWSDQNVEGLAPLLDQLLVLVELSESLLIDWLDSNGCGLF